jgi:hypothetical protein
MSVTVIRHWRFVLALTFLIWIMEYPCSNLMQHTGSLYWDSSRLFVAPSSRLFVLWNRPWRYFFQILVCLILMIFTYHSTRVNLRTSNSIVKFPLLCTGYPDWGYSWFILRCSAIMQECYLDMRCTCQSLHAIMQNHPVLSFEGKLSSVHKGLLSNRRTNRLALAARGFSTPFLMIAQSVKGLATSRWTRILSPVEAPRPEILLVIGCPSFNQN